MLVFYTHLLLIIEHDVAVSCMLIIDMTLAARLLQNSAVLKKKKKNGHVRYPGLEKGLENISCKIYKSQENVSNM